MSFLADAMKTVESVVLLRSKVERLDDELNATNQEVRQLVGVMMQFDRRLVRLETLEEVRSGARPPHRLEGN
jgi:hypothetical protein